MHNELMLAFSWETLKNFIYIIILYIYKQYFSSYGTEQNQNRIIYIWRTISSCYGSIPLALGLIGRDGGLSTQCHSFWLAFQERVLKTFPGPGYLCSEDGIVWLWHSLVNLYKFVYIYIYVYIYMHIIYDKFIYLYNIW